MNTRNALKRLAIGTFVLGLSGTIAFSASGQPLHAYGLQSAPEMRKEAPEKKGPEKAAPEKEAPGKEAPGKEGPEKEGTHESKHGHKRFFLFEDAAAVIGMQPDELKKQLEGGKSLAELAKAKGIDEAALVEKMMALRMQKVEEAVKAGKITQEKADLIKAKLPEHLKMLVTKKDWKDWGKHREEHKKKDAKQTAAEDTEEL